MSLNYKISENGVVRDATAEERAEIDALQQTAPNQNERKLSYIRKIRNEKLLETDYLGLSDNTMSSDWTAKRKSWRDIPQDYSTDKYDELLNRDDNGNLTHTVWSKP